MICFVFFSIRREWSLITRFNWPKFIERYSAPLCVYRYVFVFLPEIRSDWLYQFWICI